MRTLLKSDVDVCFTNPGTSEMHFVAALDHVPGMRCVLALFEGVATGAADGYYRMRGRPASTLLHLGPGLANGLANLHNAVKAGSGVVNIVGEHAIPHIALDAPLTSDIEGIARPMSHWVRTSGSAADVGRDGAMAVAEARTAPGRVATLILPGDTAWNEGGEVAEPVAPPAATAFDAGALAAAAAALSGPDSLILLGGAALEEDNLRLAASISAKTGCKLLTEWSNSRLERGAGRVSVSRVPYPVDLALEVLAPFKRIVLIGARAPVAFFAYPDKPGVLTREGAEIVELAAVGQDIAGALEALASDLSATTTAPAGIAQAGRPGMPQGAASPEVIGALLGRHIPENAIIVDESVTTGRAFFPLTEGAPPHSWKARSATRSPTP
ncbi:MAG: acetolactate synthase large subunit, partial [Paracoccaceae bacterium]